ncbi:UNVERIFIED_CONTAM: hypothetical protein HDU68_010402 [Siphonaria sp. JEL0065]|nr:hypothetical protein HDU68_010402 [Siphonaria sp. JEL0065]
MAIPRYRSSTAIDGKRTETSNSSNSFKPQRMQLQQTVGPRVADAAVNKHLLVLASGSTVLVHHLSTLKFTTSFGVENKINAVALSTSSMIAVSHGAVISLFKPDTASELNDTSIYANITFTYWKELRTDVSAEFLCLDWSLDGTRLLAGGSHFSIWSLQRNEVDGSIQDMIQDWNLLASVAVKKIRFSPDGTLFASIAENDRFVKVWYTANSSDPTVKYVAYDFLYLPHAAIISNFEWREQAPSSASFQPMNALLTVTTDSVSRIWCQTNTTNSLTHSAARKRHNNAEFEMRASIVPELGAATLHWIQGRAVSEAIEGAMKDGGSAGVVKGGKTLKGRGASAIKDYPDMLFAVGKEGGVVVWGIQGLEGHPQRVPKVMVILKTQSGVLSGDYEAFLGDVDIFYDSSLHESSGPVFMSSKLLAESVLGISKSIVHILATNSLATVFSPSAHIGTHVIATFDVEGGCQLWGLDVSLEPESAVALVSVGGFEVGLGKVVSVKSDMFGLLVVAREVKEKASWELSIWQGQIDNIEMRKTWKKSWTSEITAIDVIVSSDGQTLVAVATKSGVDVFCQDRLKSFNSQLEWIQVAEMTVPWEDVVKQISWLHNGFLAAALMTKVAIFSKWKDTSHNIISTEENNIPTSLQSVVSKINGRLPDYHPNLLIHYLIWGKYDFIKFVLSLVHKYIKLMTEAAESRPIRDIPSVLWKFFENEGQTAVGGANYDDLFAETSELSSGGDIGNFGQTHLDYLTEIGDRLKIPHLTVADQSRLLAIMSSFVQVEQQKRSVDENGSRFVFFARLFIATEKTSDSSVLESRDISWAFYSDSQDFLVDFVSQSFGGKPLWKDIRSLGMGFWLKNTESLRRQIEAIARNHYMAKEDKDPVDCSLFYICLKKKTVLLGLWKLASSHPEQGAMLKFLANDFSEDRWQKAAVKNAFALLGKQRYEYAVAFFLLADRLKDAVNVCLKHLKDLQLAVVLCRLFEGDESPTLVETLKTTVLPEAYKEADRYLISMIYTLLKEKDMAIKSTMIPLEKLSEALQSDPIDVIDPPLVVLHDHLEKSYHLQKLKLEKIPVLEKFRFMKTSSIIYENMGCPGLALEMLDKVSMLNSAAIVESTSKISVENIVSSNNPADSVAIDWSVPLSSHATDAFVSQQPTDTGIDWGVPVSQQPTSSVVDWGSPVSQQSTNTGMDWGVPVSQQPTSSVMDWGAPVSQQSTNTGMDWGVPVSQQPTSGVMDWGAPASQQRSSGGIDWGAPISSKVIDPVDEYEAFKQSLKQNGSGEPDELELLERELELAEEKASGISKPTEEPVIETVEIVLTIAQKERLEKIQDAIRFQRWKLAIRMIHSLHKSIAVVSLNMDVLSGDSTFKEYFRLLQTGIQKLAERVEMPLEVMDMAMTTRYREMDAFVAFVEIPCFASNERTASAFSVLLVEGSNHLSSLLFSGITGEDTKSVDLIVDFAKRLLWSVIRWYEREETGFTPIGLSVMSQTAATAFLALSVCAIRTKDYKTLWWIVGLSDRFFEVLVGGAKKKSLKPLIMDLLTHREPIIQPDSESEDDSDVEDDYYGEVSAEKALLAETLLASISLQHIGLDFGIFVRHLKDGGNADEAYGFLSEVVLTKLSSMLFEMHKAVRAKWSGSMKFKIAKMSSYLLNKYSKGVWALIKRTANVKKLAALIISGNSSVKPAVIEEKPIELLSPASDSLANESDAVSPEDEAPKKAIHYYDENSYEVVFRTKDIIGTFAINPLDPNGFAVATHETIVEFDLQASIHFHSREEVLAKRRESVDDLAIKSTHKKFLDQPNNPQSSRVAETELSLRRNLSYDSLQKAVKDSMMDLRRRDSELDSGRRIHREVVAVSSLEAHPSLNYYLAGTGDGNSESIVKLYQFGQKGDLVSYTSGTSARITKCRFDPFGGRFGCADAKGELRLWKFDATQQSLAPTQTLQCHSAITNDFAFINSSTLIATAGVSSNGSNICLFDTLLPAHKSRVKNFHVTEGGAYSIAHSNKYQSIISGGKKGDIFIYDDRQMKHLKTFHAHDTTVKSLFVDEDNGLLISGAAGGDIKVWDLSMFNNENWGSDDAALSRQGKFPGHSEKSGGMSSYGVMQISVSDNRIYTCGADGSLSRCKM